MEHSYQKKYCDSNRLFLGIPKALYLDMGSKSKNSTWTEHYGNRYSRIFFMLDKDQKNHNTEQAAEIAAACVPEYHRSHAHGFYYRLRGVRLNAPLLAGYVCNYFL